MDAIRRRVAVRALIALTIMALVAACQATRSTDKAGGDTAVLTLAPIDRRLIEPTLMKADEIAWLDAYHRRVRETLGPELDGDARAWLDEATRPLG